MSQESIGSQRDTEQFKCKHKIQLCRSYAELGFCPYGQICIFAHGYQQLQMYQPALKIRKCRNYHTNGYCKFGQRCNFRHEKNAKPRKKKNRYKFHKILNEYSDIIFSSLLISNKSPQNSIINSSRSSKRSARSQL